MAAGGDGLPGRSRAPSLNPRRVVDLRREPRASLAAGLVALLVGVVALGYARSAVAQEVPDEPDLTEAGLRLEDLPDGFFETADLFTIGGLTIELLARAQGATVHEGRVFADGAGTEVVESLLIGPLTSAEQADFGTLFADATSMVQTVAEAVPPFGGSGTWAVVDTAGLGESAFGCWISADEQAGSSGEKARSPGGVVGLQTAAQTRIEVALARRGGYLLAVAVTHDGLGDPIADAVDLARLADRRLAGALGLSIGGFRPPGVLVPDLTTHIPTVIDVSTDPAVIGANLLLAALAMVAFVVASEVLDRTLAAHEALLQQAMGPARWLGRVQRRIDVALATRLRGGPWPDRLRLAGIVAIYGLIFSFLQPGWSPFSVTGFFLFLAMALAFGVVGLSSGIAKWAVARRLQLPAGLSLRPANLLLAGASTGFSRAFSLVPGLMLGKPEAFDIAEARPETSKQGRVLGAGALTLAGVGAVAWLATIPTSLLQRAELPGWLAGGIGGVEAFLLLVFAIAVQSLFVELLVFPNTAGRFLSRRHRLLWLASLVGVAFVFWHTLINPSGRLASALKTANVRFFLAVVGAFVAFAVGVWAYGRHRTRPLPVAGAAGLEAVAGIGPAPAPAGNPPSVGPAAAWHPDPTGRHQYRYWDGARWTDWVADGGEQGRDPLAGR